MTEEMRRICVVTGSRAEFGLLRGLVSRIQENPTTELQLLVTGSHLSPAFGCTVTEIREAGFPIAAEAGCVPESDSALDTAAAMGFGVRDIAAAMAGLAPDIVVLLGDRTEILAAACAALALRIPIAHLHGGELTEGAYDDAIRHAVTKLSHLHFPTDPPYARRIIQMGEAPERVFTVGSLGIEAIVETELLPVREVAGMLGLSLGDRPLLMVTYHAETLGGTDGAGAFQAVLDALDRLPNSFVVFTYANSDPGGRAINAMIDRYAADRADRVRAFASLGRRKYLSALNAADAVVGNSSSGLLEAPTMGLPTVNVGTRQKGRLRASSVIDCETDAGAIAAAIRSALGDEMREAARRERANRRNTGTSHAILEILRTTPLEGLTIKSFHDVAFDTAALPHGD